MRSRDTRDALPPDAAARIPSSLELDAVDAAWAEARRQGMFKFAAHLGIEQTVALQRRLQFSAALTASEAVLDDWHSYLDEQDARDKREVRALSHPPVSGGERDQRNVADDVVAEVITEVTTELRIRGLCAVQSLRQGVYEKALDHLRAAEPLLLLVPPSLVTARIAWTRALLEQWRNTPRAAVGYALSALRLYCEQGSRIEEARLRQQAANIVLDCASMAQAHGQQARAETDLGVARTLLDFEGPAPTGLYAEAVNNTYRLMYARYSRLSGRNENRVALIESVGRQAQRGLDQTLSGQAYTTLGDEFAAQGRWGEALTCYRQAIDLLTKSNTPALAVWPLRHLAWAQEMGVS